MINVKVKWRNGKLVSVILKGHSGYSQEGSDIVCSAATAISTCIGDGLLEVLKIQANCIAENGSIKVDISNNSLQEIDRCQVLMETMVLGLKNIEILHGSYIRISEEEV